MTRTYLSLATVFILASAGCAKKNDQTQNPDASTGDSDAVDDGSGSSDDQTPSRARRSTAPRGADGKVKARTVTAKKPPRAPINPSEPTDDANGLLAEAFELDSPEALPTDFSDLEVKQSFAVANLDFYQVDSFPGLTALSEDYALRFTGSINVVDEAEYELCLHSDDGSQLLLEDTLVVDNDGVLDGPVEACELVFLPAGEYALEIRYFQTSGPVTMQFAWGIDGGQRGIIPQEVLFKPVP